VFWFSLQFLSNKFLILWRIRRVIIIYVKMSACKVPVILVGFYRNLFCETNNSSVLNVMLSSAPHMCSGAEVSASVHAGLCLLRKVLSKGPEAFFVDPVVHSKNKPFRADRPVVPTLGQDILTIRVPLEPWLSLCYRICCLKPVVIYTLLPLEKKIAIVLNAVL
jgi:hypothetical protein